jgi:mycofactocin system transcriptional regulator
MDASAEPRVGRRPSTTRAELGEVAFELFAKQGFEATTVDDIAAAAGIGRRTFFRYFASKNDVPWGEFDERLDDMRRLLAGLPDEMPLVEAVRVAVVEFNRVPPGDVPHHRRRMELLLGVPTLMAHSTLRYEAWRQVVAEFAGRRLGMAEDALEPQAIGWASLGIALSAYEHWLAHPGSDLTALLDRALRLLATGFEPDENR